MPVVLCTWDSELTWKYPPANIKIFKDENAIQHSLEVQLVLLHPTAQTLRTVRSCQSLFNAPDCVLILYCVPIHTISLNPSWPETQTSSHLKGEMTTGSNRFLHL